VSSAVLRVENSVIHVRETIWALGPQTVHQLDDGCCLREDLETPDASDVCEPDVLLSGIWNLVCHPVALALILGNHRQIPRTLSMVHRISFSCSVIWNIDMISGLK
jgi:hypothetical protein